MLNAVREGETDSVIVYAVYEDQRRTADGPGVSYQVDPDLEPIDELLQAVAEARAYLQIDDEQPLAIELDQPPSHP